MKDTLNNTIVVSSLSADNECSVASKIKEFANYALKRIQLLPARSYADRAKKIDCEAFCDSLNYASSYATHFDTAQDLERILLNGADSWYHYAWSGCGLCYTQAIAEHYLPPSQRKISSEKAMNTEAHHLSLACARMKRIFTEWKNSI